MRNRASRVTGSESSPAGHTLKTEAPVEAEWATCAPGAARGLRTVEARNSPRASSSATRINNINSGIRLFVFAFEYQTHRVGVTNVRRRADSRSRNPILIAHVCTYNVYYTGNSGRDKDRKFCGALTIRPVLGNVRIRIIAHRLIFILSLSRNNKIGSGQREECPCQWRYHRRAHFHEADNPRTGARDSKIHDILIESRVYTFTRTYARTAEDTPGVYIYIPTYWGLRFGGTPSTRLDLRLFNSSACQKHQCTLCSLIVLFPFLSFSVFRPLPFDPFDPLAYSHAEPTLFPSFSPFREYTALLPPPPLSLPDITVFCLSSSRTVPLSRFSVSVRHAATLRSRPPAPFGVEND